MPANKVLSGIETLVAPKLNEILGELKAINARIDSTNERIDSTNERIDSLESKARFTRKAYSCFQNVIRMIYLKFSGCI